MDAICVSNATGSTVPSSVQAHKTILTVLWASRSNSTSGCRTVSRGVSLWCSYSFIWNEADTQVGSFSYGN